MKRKFTTFLRVSVLLLIVLFLILQRSGSPSKFIPEFGSEKVTSVESSESVNHKENGDNDPSSPPEKSGNSTLLAIAPAYVKVIMSPEDESLSRLLCPTAGRERYEYLKNPDIRQPPKIKYFFALDLYQCVDLLPRLLGSIVESMRFLGPQYCALSIVEGRSDDGTFEVLKLMRSELEKIGASFFLGTNEIDPWSGTPTRVQALAELRNQAVRPLVENPHLYDSDTTVVFFNDVSICTEDILELIHQRIYQKADMTCAMDWTYVGQDPTFYDIWIARGMNGDSFFNIPEDGNWNSAWNLFWNEPKAQQGLMTAVPFQVFSCWNGAVAFTAAPLLKKVLKFRSSRKDECFQGEPQLFCKDMWQLGYGKIAVVPSINLEYSDEGARKIKELKGYVSELVGRQGGDSPPIEWELSPPAMVKCIPTYEHQIWIPWNEGHNAT